MPPGSEDRVKAEERVALLAHKNWLARAWAQAFAPIKEPEGFYRHRALVRLTHWINALCTLFLLGSGLVGAAGAVRRRYRNRNSS